MSNLANYIASIPATGYWRLGESGKKIAVDAAGSNHLIWNSPATQVDGLVNNDLDYAQQIETPVQIAHGSPYAYTNNFSCSCIIESKVLNQFGYIVWNGKSDGTNGWSLSIQDGGGGVGLFLAVIFGGVTYLAVTPRTIEPSAKYFIVLVVRSGIVEIWFNGLLYASSATYAPLTPTTDFTIGNLTAGAASNFDGIVDEVAVYNLALSPAQILEMAKLVWAQPPGIPGVTVADSGDGRDEFTLTAATEVTFPVDGYAIWESTSSDEDSFEFDRAPLATIAVGGTFAARTAARGKYYAVKAFDDRDEPNYGSPVVVASVAVPMDVLSEVSKIHRASTPKAAGASVTRNKVGTATASTLTETLS